jgi:peroxiredoxin
MEGKVISLRHLMNKPALLMAFDPDCEHCEYEINDLKKQLSLLADTQILLITSADSVTTRRFSTDHELDRYPQISVLRSEAEIFYKTFGNNGVPAIFMYNESGNLQQAFRGEWKIDVIAKQLKSEP